MATLVSFRVSPRQKCTDEGEVVGNGNGNSIGRRAIGDERTNEPSMAHSIERKSRQTDFIPLSLSLSLSLRLDFSKRTDVKMVVLLAYPSRLRVKE